MKSRTTSLWNLVEVLQTRLEHEGLDPRAVDATVIRGLQALFGVRRRRRGAPQSFALAEA